MTNSNLGGTRINSFNENFLNECDQDANSVLTELDKGKRCNVKPNLKYIILVLIRSAFVKNWGTM